MSLYLLYVTTRLIIIDSTFLVDNGNAQISVHWHTCFILHID